MDVLPQTRQIESAKTYFENVDKGELPFELFTPDFEFFFPKYGVGRGPASIANCPEWSPKQIGSHRPAKIFPYVEAVLHAFIPKRVMFESDWTLVTLASSYRRWCETVRAWIAQLSPTEREWILSRTAHRSMRIRYCLIARKLEPHRSPSSELQMDFGFHAISTR
jgi:hypothetical protein